jgi:hypothetical protein
VIEGSVTIGYLHPGEVSHAFSTSLLEVIMADLADGQRLFRHENWRLANEVGTGDIAKGRNEIARAVLDQTEAEWLFMVDADMAFSGTIIEDLIESAELIDARVMGALCFASKRDGSKQFGAIRYRSIPTIYDFVEFVEGSPAGVVPMLEYKRGSVIKCSATGGAAVLIHRTVLEEMRAQFLDDWFSPIRHPTGTVFSEDLSFFLRCAGIDADVFVDTAVKTAHHKGNLWLDEENYDIEMATRAASSGSATVASNL